MALRSDKFLSPVEERALLIQAKAGDRRAVERLVVAFEPLVKTYAAKRSRFGVDVEDLMQEGRIGLLKALERFDVTAENRFGVYAKWWVKSEVDTYLAVNVSMVRDRSIHTKPGQHGGIIHAIYRSVGSRGGGDCSLDVPAHSTAAKSASQTWGDRLVCPSPSAETVLGECQDYARKIVVLKGMKQRLTERERAIIDRRWPDEEGYGESLEEISVTYGVTRERIRQIEVVALNKLGVPQLRGRRPAEERKVA